MFTKFNFDIASLLPSDMEAMLPSAAGLFVSPERTIETDGHQVVIVSAPESQPTLFDQPDGLEEAQFFTPFLMDRESALKIGKLMPKRNPEAPENSMAMLDVHTEAESDSTIAVTEDARRAIFKSLKRDATRFPDFDKFVPAIDRARFEISFNADVLVPVLNIFRKFAGQDNYTPNITVRLYGPSDGVRIDAEACGQKMTAVVMPLRQSQASVGEEQPKAKTQILRCTCGDCGTVYDASVKTDCPLSESTDSMKAVRCPKCGSSSAMLGGNHPDAPSSTVSIEERIAWWRLRGEHGTSSKTIFSVFTGDELAKAGIPYDPDDYRRCRLLFDLIPEWRADIGRVVDAYPWFKPLTDVWDELDHLYDEELPTGSCPKLYDRMKELEVESIRIQHPDADIDLDKNGHIASWRTQGRVSVSMKAEEPADE